MILRAVLLVLLLALPTLAGARSVTVTSGEHDGFTRLALDFGEPVDWQMGRTTDGYVLRVNGARPDYDLSAVFNPIGRDRISAIWVDEATGDLNLGIGCACFAMPFAFRPSIVVIDIKPGKPPKGSAFEAALDPAPARAGPKPAPAPRPVAADTGPAYDWVGARFADGTASPQPEAAPQALPLPAGEGLDRLRETLIEEMSRGAAAGLIDLTLPRDVTEGMVVGIPSVQVTQGDKPNYASHLGEASDVPVTAEGEACLPEETFAVGSWKLSDEPVAVQMSQVMSGLVGEFDKPDPEALKRAVRFDLYLGFGAEARALLRAFPIEEADAGVWESMSFVVDGEEDTRGALRSQAACDTSGALWAALAIPDLTHEPSVNTRAIVRAFSALPPHLRLALGPRLADRLLAIHDDLAARSVRDAVTRLPGATPAEVTLLQAKLDVAQGDLGAAEARLAPLAAEPGPASDDALAELVTATANDLKPIAPEQVDALAAIAQERRDGEDAARFEAAVTLGRAAAGQFAEAFKGAAGQPAIAARVWQILSVLGTDDDVAIHAVLPPGASPPAEAAPAAERLAERLLALGFVDQAAAWLALAPEPDPQIVARLALAQRDGVAALQAVAGLEDPAARDLKAQSLSLTGNHRAAADVYHALGNDASYWTAEALALDWPTLAQGDAGAWSDAARSLLSDPAPPPPSPDQPAPGPLAEARAITASAEETRAALDALLAAVPAPQLPSQ